MMKKVMIMVLFLSGAATLKVAAQKQVETPNMPYDSTQKKIIYTEVVQMPGMTKDALYDRAMTALTNNIKEAENKMSVKDKAAGKIELRCSTRVSLKDPKNGLMVPQDDIIKYKLTLYFKDGKYKYDVQGFNVDKGGYPYYLEKWYLHDYTEKKEDRANEKLTYLDNEVRTLISKIKADIANPKTEKKSDW